MTIYRYETTIPVKVVSALHSGGVDEAPEREYVDEDGRTAQPNEFVRNGLGEAVLPGRSIKGAVRTTASPPRRRPRCGRPSRSTPSLWASRIVLAESTSLP